ncbi:MULTISPECIES: acyl-CoA dehydrogenase family protein [Streptomyces]|uniref:DNA alkylation response protein n=1 Tax=Streptomyces tsukubensis (strain DSM 42081 / NBRC 108919 / NRRL 18488 / 9993) TaxID=1114943 RepID=I2N8M0_STRT9|nr:MULTISPECIES: acyl-CoA dehydrogenase family protein [Streptomyces]AZK97242.1 DNA alkylation response protein [Streptomyces tsukubensis]EIF93367.1 putative acyl-CoA dehydrogenase [Streptomyces tsukubensis NRRL18488]MYS65779.1 DNA alkylation response protein [Streptomyces sp. SID5473]QKM66792.1 DNA alkylation response protein [Streptomyces tsukubensis NRRL18488]TAI44861.1 DNA alkylation response protein [Streptomyces tsukubensis]
MATSTHTVTNQAPPLVGYDVFGSDRALTEAVARHTGADLPEAPRAALAETVTTELTELGRAAGSAQAQEWGRLANENPPKLRTHDRYGNRIDEVEFHPAWHRLLGRAVGAGLTDAWSRPSGHVRRAAGFLVTAQTEAGHGCPLSMTHAAVPALRADPALAAEWEPRLTSHGYAQELLPAERKPGVLFGMGMTEKQGGSDVRANTTRAEALAGGAGEYVLTGHKWFCSAPMSDGFLVLAQAPEGLTCFLVPRVLADGVCNVFRIQRLKDKLGNRSNASAEVEFEGTWARRVGDEGRGVRTIIGMVAATRLDCVLGSAAQMRQAVAQAIHHTAYRNAFGGPLIDKPLMRNVLADLALESEAATVLGMRLAAAYDADTEAERALLRIAVPAAKYWVTKRCTPMVGEALECLGGNGYVEESGMPRLLREAPLNSIWEGSGNVQALDVLRALTREPGALDAFLREVGLARGADHRLDGAIKGLLTELADLEGAEGRARRLVERMALVLQGSLLVRWAPPEVADAFCASRLGGDWGTAFGTLPRGLATGAVVERARAVV